MKYIRFTFPLKKGFANIGDYIQVMAAMRFIEEKGLSDDVVVWERDKLNTFVSEDGEPYKAIMNGWFTYEPYLWPPSRYVTPLFVSFHLNSNVSDAILSKKANVDYFKRYEPIGCRDEYTAQSLRRKGIKAYFSGCLTLTLGDRYMPARKTGSVIIVDPYFKKSFSLISLLRNFSPLLRKYGIIKGISKGMYGSAGIKNLMLTAQFYRIYTKLFSSEIIENAEYITHWNAEAAAMKTDDERFAFADRLLRKYAGAGLIITSRIHCALPSIGMDTPVVFTFRAGDREDSLCRYGGLKDLFNVAYIDDKHSYIKTEQGEIIEKVSNPGQIPIVNKYKKYKDELIERCQRFIKPRHAAI